MPNADVVDALRSIGEQVRTDRYARRWSQAQLGRASGLSQSSISRLEHGVAPSLRLERCARILAVLKSGRALGPWIPMAEADERLLHHRARRLPSADLDMPPRA